MTTDTLNAQELAQAQQALLERHAETVAELREMRAANAAARPAPYLDDELAWIKATVSQISCRRYDLKLDESRLLELRTIRDALMAFHDSLEREAAARQRASWGVAVA